MIFFVVGCCFGALRGVLDLFEAFLDMSMGKKDRLR
jgi:hypothetical protein